MAQIVIACPGDIITGGVELLYQLSSELSQYADVVLWDKRKDKLPDIPQEYAKYNAKWIAKLPDSYDSIIIMPEIWANDITGARYKSCKRVIYWESVDNYLKNYRKKNQYKFATDRDVIHLTQSHYAETFLDKISGEYAPLDHLYIGDYLNEDFMKVDSFAERDDIIIYNPKKGFDFTKRFMTAFNHAEFIPLRGYSRKEVIKLMGKSKLYIDFGQHPGMDRIPREAAMCGCCVITSMYGSAAFYEDVPIPGRYKFDLDRLDMSELCNTASDVLNNYHELARDFDGYREFIRGQKDVFKNGCKRLCELLGIIETDGDREWTEEKEKDPRI